MFLHVSIISALSFVYDYVSLLFHDIDHTVCSVIHSEIYLSCFQLSPITDSVLSTSVQR